MTAFRYIAGESATAYAVGNFNTADTVTISVYDIATSAAETLTDNTCSEIGSTGIFKWAFSNLQTAPTSKTEYLWIMTNGATEQKEMTIFGGYPDTLVTALSGTTGASQVTLTIENQSSVAIGGVKVTILNNAEDTVLGVGTTDVNGQLVFNIDDGTYKIRLTKAQVTFAASETLVVSGNTAQTYSGTQLTLDPAVIPNVNRVYSLAFNQSGTNPVQEIDATAQIVNLPFNSGNMFHVGKKITATFDTASGQFYWELPYSAVVSFNAPDFGITGQATIPSQTLTDLKDLTLT